MSRFSRRTQGNVPSGSRGERATATKEGNPVLIRDTSKVAIPPTQAPGVTEEMPGSIGLSVSVGHATEYGRDKFEVSVWCTLPCGEADDSRQEVFEQCRQEVLEKVAALRQEVVSALNLPFEEDQGGEEIPF